jgi:hypothetical protein
MITTNKKIEIIGRGTEILKSKLENLSPKLSKLHTGVTDVVEQCLRDIDERMPCDAVNSSVSHAKKLSQVINIYSQFPRNLAALPANRKDTFVDAHYTGLEALVKKLANPISVKPKPSAKLRTPQNLSEREKQLATTLLKLSNRISAKPSVTPSAKPKPSAKRHTPQNLLQLKTRLAATLETELRQMTDVYQQVDKLRKTYMEMQKVKKRKMHLLAEIKRANEATPLPILGQNKPVPSGPTTGFAADKGLSARQLKRPRTSGPASASSCAK